MYRVDLGTNTGGHFENFITKKKALEFIKLNKSYPFITLEHGDKRIRIKNDPDSKTGDENCEHHWIGEFGHVKCNKCNAIMNIACNHTGSVGCYNCALQFAEELNNKKCTNIWKKTGDYCSTCGNPLKDGVCKNEFCYILKG